MFRLCKAILVVASALSIDTAWANHPVLVEGNCDSPVPGTTIVSQGTCGDFDGDGRIGTAEDTDGADRIFGTIGAALGPGTGAAAGTGANQNGTITIVRSGRFAEKIRINPTGNVIIQGAPDVEAQIDAVLQGDPAGGNTGRQEDIGVLIDSPTTSGVLLKNLTIRNWFVGVYVINGNVTLIDVRIGNSVRNGVYAVNSSKVTIDNSAVVQTGFRTSGAQNFPVTSPPTGNGGIFFGNASSGGVFRTLVSNNFGFGIADSSSGPVTQLDNYLFNNNPDTIPVVP